MKKTVTSQNVSKKLNFRSESFAAAISFISWLKITDSSRTILVRETLVIFNRLTRLIARENCIKIL
jgi:hypothetical protein